MAIEPLLTPLSGEQFNLRSTITEEHARVDVSARDVWVRGSRAFFDIMVFNPLARSYSNSTLKASHKSNENLKKRKYNDRILQVEHGSFTPLVFTNFGGVGVEGSNFYMADNLWPSSSFKFSLIFDIAVASLTRLYH